jgi:tRNA-dihydrouridine synthase B
MNYWKEKIKIKNLLVPRFMSAPLDGITDSPFRKLVRLFSKDALLYSEMRHVRSVVTPKGGALALKFDQIERPLNFQVAANSPEFVIAACERIRNSGVDSIDLNLGCPAKNVISSCSGSALMANPQKLEEILQTFRSALPDLPFTVKIRAGFKVENAVEIAQLAEACGVDALAIHPRLQTQKFTGRPDYTVAAKVKQALSIPVFFSGDVVNFKTAKITYEQTGVDGYLVGRGMWAKPWKLLEMERHSQGEEFELTNEMILNVALNQLDYMLEHYGPHGLYCFRKHLPFYIKGQAQASKLRSNLMIAESAYEIKAGLIEFLG